MDFSSWTNNTIAALIQIRGEGARDANGNRLPLITPLDTIAVLGRFSQPIIGAIGRIQDHHDAPRGAIDAQYVDSDNVVTGAGVSELSAIANRISLVDYVAGYGDPYQPHKRRKEKSDSTQYTFFIGDFLGTAETNITATLREVMRDWQRAIDASSAAIIHKATNLNTQPIDATDNAAFWSAIRSLAAWLAALDENPPEDIFDRIKGATQEALDKTGQFAGKAAAELANQTGKLAGNVAEGFFSQASAVSFLVAGLAVYLVIK